MPKLAAPSSWECSGDPPLWDSHSSVINQGIVCFVCGKPCPTLKVSAPTETDLIQPANPPQWATPPLAVPTPTTATPPPGDARSPAYRPVSSRITPLPALLSVLRPRRSAPGRLVVQVLLLGVILMILGRGVTDRFGPAVQAGEQTDAQGSASTAVSPFSEKNPERYSQGERRLLRFQANPEADLGTVAFAAGDYRRAQVHFTRAIEGERRNPELQIYLNNTIARLAPESPLTLAVVIPVEASLTTAEEILRGVADAQTQLNADGGVEGRDLQILIVNDDSDPTIAVQVAQELAANPAILGVIGHANSTTSLAALPIYEQARVAMVSPTSGSTLLSGDVFFRVNVSNQVSAANLAEYARRSLKLDRITLFYDPGSASSKSSQSVFSERFQALGGQVKSIDMTVADFDPVAQVKALRGQTDAIALLPETRSLTIALSIATANGQQPAVQRFKLLGGNALYRPQTLLVNDDSMLGLVLPVPWIAETPYAKRASHRWGGQINWRTAMSYDATQALIHSLSTDAFRASVLNHLKSIRLSETETSGRPLQFSSTGDRLGNDSILVQVVRGASGPDGSKFVFKPIQ